MTKKKLTGKNERKVEELKEIILSIRNDPVAMKQVKKLAVAC